VLTMKSAALRDDVSFALLGVIAPQKSRKFDQPDFALERLLLSSRSAVAASSNRRLEFVQGAAGQMVWRSFQDFWWRVTRSNALRTKNLAAAGEFQTDANIAKSTTSATRSPFSSLAQWHE